MSEFLFFELGHATRTEIVSAEQSLALGHVEGSVNSLAEQFGHDERFAAG